MKANGYVSPMDEVRYKSLFLVFSGKLHDAIMSGQVSLTVENVFVENDIFGECVFWTLTVGMIFLEIVWNLFSFACICSTTTTSKLHFISNRFCMMMFLEKVLERSVYFLDWRFSAEHWKDAFATCANACGCG